MHPIKVADRRRDKALKATTLNDRRIRRLSTPRDDEGNERNATEAEVRELAYRLFRRATRFRRRAFGGIVTLREVDRLPRLEAR